jgi:hypothetical protein
MSRRSMSGVMRRNCCGTGPTSRKETARCVYWPPCNAGDFCREVAWCPRVRVAETSESHAA